MWPETQLGLELNNQFFNRFENEKKIHLLWQDEKLLQGFMPNNIQGTALPITIIDLQVM